MNIFSSDGWFSRFFGTLGDIIIVNILFILCSIPIVTMGASMSAMYFTLLKKQRTGENGGIVKLFFKGFKDNFKQSTISWLLFLLISFIFTLDFNLFGKGGPQENKLMYYTSVVLMILTCFIAIYLFPVISAFKNTLKNLLLQSIYLAAKNFIFTIVIMVLYTLPAYVMLSSTQVFMVGIFVFIVCGFGLIAYVSSFMFLKAFTPYLDEVTKKYTDDDPASWMHSDDCCYPYHYALFSLRADIRPGCHRNQHAQEACKYIDIAKCGYVYISYALHQPFPESKEIISHELAYADNSHK